MAMREQLRSFFSHSLSLAEVSAELFGIELQEAVECWLGHLFWISMLAIFSGLVGLLLSVLLLILFWDTHRVEAALALLTFYAAGAGFAAWRLRQRLVHAEPLFSASLAEVRELRRMLDRDRRGEE